MLLAIEQGNTNTLFAVHDGESWIAQWRSATHSTRTADEYAVWLSQLLAMAGLQLGVFDGCIISSVVPQSIFNLRNLARRYLKVEPLVIGENVELGIEVRIEKPSEAGADRLVDEMLFCFTHDIEIDFMLPGVKPSGKYVEIPLVAIVNFRGPKLYHEHIYWDQASVLAQIGLLDPAKLPIAGVDTAKKLLNEKLPSNTLMRRWPESEGK